ncbi:MAG: hypothetical protein PWP46_720, partial [Fusobacteriaceae bacterium]|nr:hypothetical protein [Fusobacteriaceae bacterium]
TICKSLEFFASFFLQGKNEGAKGEIEKITRRTQR